MAKITVKKTNNFSIVSNEILQDKRLSVKARFILVFCLSLADTWEYSVAGLASAMGCSKDAVTTGLKELEKHGYLVRNRVRDAKGRLKGTDYTLYEKPQTPMTVFPAQEKPTEENPAQEKPSQTNTNYINNKYINTAAERACAREEETAAVIKTFSDNVHPISGEIERDKLIDLLERYGADWVCSAIKEAVECNGRNLRYIERILQAWEKRGQKGGGKHGGHKGKGGTSETAEQTAWDDEPDTL